MDPYDITSPIYGGNRTNSNEVWKECNDVWKECNDGHGRNISESDGALSECTISDDTDCAVNGSDRSSDRSVHFNENIEIITLDNSWLQSCGCCYSMGDYIYNHYLSTPILLYIILFLCIVIITGFLYFLFYM